MEKVLIKENYLKRFERAAWFAAGTVLEGIYAFFFAWGVVRLIPPTPVSLQVWLPEAIRGGLRPEHDVVLYAVYILVVSALAILVGPIFFKKDQNPVTGHWRVFWIIEAILIGLIVNAAFKMIIYDYRPQLAQNVFYFLLAVSLAHKIFWKFAWDQVVVFRSFLDHPGNRPFLKMFADVSCIGLVIMVIFIPYPEAMLARMFVGEQCHHFNHAVMGPAWAYWKGAILNIDVISPYGLGLPIFLAYLSTLFGGFSYEHVVTAMIAVHIAYFAGWYVLLRVWWANRIMALAAVLWAVKTQMFHTGVFPIVFTYPSATIIRYCFDVIFLLLIWMHLSKEKKGCLLGAAALSGFAIFYLTDTGVYLCATYYAYLLLLLVNPAWRAMLISSRRDIGYLASLLFLPFGALFLFLTVFNKGWMSAQFWANMKEFIEYFISGFGLTPMTESLMYHNYCASFVGFFIPAVYVLTLVWTGGLCFLNKIRRQYLFVVILCVYGLGIYHYYIARSAVTSYYAVGVPYVAIIFFWVKTAIDRLPREVRTPLAFTFLAMVIYALFTTHNFVSYPNVFNLSKNPMTDPFVAQPLPNNRKPYFHHLWHDYPQELRLAKNFVGETDERLVTESNFGSDDELVEYYRRELDFKEDVDLIRRLTGPDEKVALLSSFDVKMLMDADRRPLFYYFPFANERPMYMRTFFVERVYTVNELKRVIAQLEKEKPKYIFMEKVLLTKEYPQEYQFHLYGTIHVLDYVKQNYTPGEEGKYLVVMERKN